MYCKQCKTLAKGNSKICPLCHGEMDKNEFIEESSYIEETYVKEKIDGKKLFRRIYLLCAIDITVIFSIVSYFFLRSNLYPLLMACIFLYIFLLVDNTILGSKNAGKRIFMQCIFLCVLCAIIQIVFPPKHEWAITYAIPLIAVISSIVLGVFSIIMYKGGRFFFLSFIGLSVIGIMPIFATWISPNISLDWPTMVSFTVSISIVSSLLFFKRKELWAEFRKLLHI